MDITTPPSLWIALGLLGTVLSSSASAQTRAGRRDSLFAADSIVLERTRCFGTCPAYRLSVSRSGKVHFESRNPDDETRATADVPTIQFEWILSKAHHIDFLALPNRIADNKHYCPTTVTDNPTAIVTVFMGAGSKRVEDYYGCYWAPAGLRELEEYVDRVTNAKRWIRPARGS